MQLVSTLSLSLRAAALVPFFMFAVTACGESDECSTNTDCPTGRICRLGLCALDPGGDTLQDTLADVPLDCLVAGPDDLIMTEILADPPAGADTDGNGAASSSGDEFVEVVNIAARPVALTNVQIDVGGKRVGLGSVCLNPYQARVIFGSGELPQLTNTSGSVSLVVDGNVVQNHTYGDEAGKDSSITLSRQLDKTSAWVVHKDVAPTAYSVGTCSNGNAFPDCEGGVNPDAEVIGDSEVVPSCTAKPAAGDLVINELLADPGDLDANGDGIPNGTDDEFVEVVNVSSSTLSLDGIVFKDAGTKVFNLPAGLCLEPNQVLLIFGKYAGTGSFGDAIVLSGNNLSLNNDADTVTLLDAASAVLSQATYTGNLANADQAIVRETDLSGSAAFVRHTLAANAGGRRMSPGFCQSGNQFPDCTIVVEPTDVTDISDGEVAETVDPGDATNDVEASVDVGPGCGPLATAADLILNEALLDPPSGFDANGDGTADTTQDEFVEIVNAGIGPVRLFGLKVADLERDRYTFGEVCLGVNEAVVVFGKGAKLFGASGVTELDNVLHTLSLNNTSETILLRYSSAPADVLVTQALAEAADQSWTRSPDISGGFVKHKTATPAVPATPGACVSGAVFPGCIVP